MRYWQERETIINITCLSMMVIIIFVIYNHSFKGEIPFYFIVRIMIIPTVFSSCTLLLATHNPKWDFVCRHVTALTNFGYRNSVVLIFCRYIRSSYGANGRQFVATAINFLGLSFGLVSLSRLNYVIKLANRVVIITFSFPELSAWSVIYKGRAYNIILFHTCLDEKVTPSPWERENVQGSGAGGC